MLKQKFSFDIGAKFFMYLVTAVTGIVVARIVGPKIMGTIAYGLSFVSLFWFLFGLFGTSHIKLISEGEDQKKCNYIYSVIILISMVLFVLIVLMYYWIQVYYFNNSITPTEETVIFITLAYLSIQGLYKIPEITFVGLIQQAKVNIPLIIRTVAYNIGRIIVVLLGYKAVALVSVNLATSLLIIPLYLSLMGKHFWGGKWDNQLFRKYIKIGFPMFVITVTNTLTLHYGRIMLKDYSSVEQLGYYFGGYSIAGMLLMLGNTAGGIFFPLFSKAFKEKNIDYIRNQIKKYEHFLLIFIFPIIIILSIYSDPIIPFLLSDKYAQSIPIFSVLVFVSFFMMLGIPYFNLIKGMSEFKIGALFNFIFFIIFFGLLFLFLHNDFLNLGAVGLAYGMLILSIIKLITWYVYNNKKVQISFDKNIIKIGLLYLIIYGMSFIVNKYYIHNYKVYVKFIFIFFNFTTIYLGLFIFGFFKKTDLVFLLEVVNLKSLASYAKKEIKNK